MLPSCGAQMLQLIKLLKGSFLSQMGQQIKNFNFDLVLSTDKVLTDVNLEVYSKISHWFWEFFFL